MALNGVTEQNSKETKEPKEVPNVEWDMTLRDAIRNMPISEKKVFGGIDRCHCSIEGDPDSMGYWIALLAQGETRRQLNKDAEGLLNNTGSKPLVFNSIEKNQQNTTGMDSNSNNSNNSTNNSNSDNIYSAFRW